MGNPEGVGPSGDMVRREAMEVMRGQYEERCRVLYIQIADLIQERQKHVEFLETVFRQITDLRRDVASMAPAPPIFLQASPEAIERLVAAQATRALGPAVPVRSATEADVATLQEDLRRARFTIVELQRQVDDLQGRPKHFDEGRGLYEKFEVRRTNGSSEPGCKHHGCRYFIIDYSHDPFAPVALCAYASACQSSHPQLATEILDLFSNETIKKSSTVQVRSATEADIATLQEALHQARLTNQRLQKEMDDLEKVVFSLEAIAQSDQSLISQQADQIAVLQNRVHELETDAQEITELWDRTEDRPSGDVP
jgi:uncharacterized protein YeeX (DUF496 family)